jgi:hypothetical protein
MAALRKLSTFIDESGDFEPAQQHSPFYILSIARHDQSDCMTARNAEQVRERLAQNLIQIHQRPHWS